MEGEFVARFWEERDSEWLRDAIKGFLQEGMARGGDVLDSERNIECYLRLGLAGAERKDPCLIALLNSLYVGFVYWIGIPNAQLDTRWKTIQALGTYTLPEFRGQGIANRLRLLARGLAKVQGYERIFGPVSAENRRGIEVFEKEYGARVCVYNFEQFIK
jgi:GNAT superfamily N-acetyltransferase